MLYRETKKYKIVNMDIPFALRFLKKVELFQVLKKLDAQFKIQLKKDDGVVPLWEVEKKILFWAYTNHKHLGSPLKIKELQSKKSIAIKMLGKNSGIPVFDNKINKIKEVDANSFETIYETYLKDWQDIISEINSTSSIKKIEIGLSPEETDKIGIREVFGNLVSRGYARYFPDIQKELDHWEKESLSLERAVYNQISTTQLNCEGIYITSEGMLMGEIIHSIFILKNIEKDNFSPTIDFYKKITGTTNFLYIKKLNLFFYNFLIVISYIALFLITWLIFKEFINFLKSLLGLLY